MTFIMATFYCFSESTLLKWKFLKEVVCLKMVVLSHGYGREPFSGQSEQHYPSRSPPATPTGVSGVFQRSRCHWLLIEEAQQLVGLFKWRQQVPSILWQPPSKRGHSQQQASEAIEQAMAQALALGPDGHGRTAHNTDADLATSLLLLLSE